MSSHSNVAQARGDLGFIANQRHHGGNRTFFGGTPVPSKKGVALYSQVSRMQTELNAAVPKPEITGDGMLGRRTDWLEGQERKLTATLNETRGETQRLAEQIAASMGALEACNVETKRLNHEHEKASKKAQQLYDEQQWVYGKTSKPLKAVLCSDKVHLSLEQYRTSRAETELKTVAKAGSWVLLSYPMERVELDDGHQYLMRCKTVNAKTGQLTVCWAIVFEQVGGKETRVISEFSMVPHQLSVEPKPTKGGA